jgi:sulfite exporter TauE/SafE
MDIITPFMIGLIGSLHCIGMCGPIVLALPYNSPSVLSLIWGRTVYNIGRVLTYSLMGAFAGLFANKFLLAGFQSYASIILGVVIIIYLILPNKVKASFANNFAYKTISGWLRYFYTNFQANDTFGYYFIFGLVNGLLPCGLVYVALIGSFTAGNFVHGFINMFAFGLGTFPVMFLTSMATKFITLNLRNKVAKILPYLTFVLAVIFILRGLNLGIPFISPNLNKMEKKEQLKEVIQDTTKVKEEIKSDCCM